MSSNRGVFEAGRVRHPCNKIKMSEYVCVLYIIYVTYIVGNIIYVIYIVGIYIYVYTITHKRSDSFLFFVWGGGNVGSG